MAGLGATLMWFSAGETYEGSQRLAGAYNHYLGQAVYDSFIVETYPGEINYLGRLATDAATTAAMALAGKLAVRVASAVDYGHKNVAKCQERQ